MADSEKVSSLPSERERFEEWADEALCYHMTRYGNEYVSHSVTCAWQAWQVASAGRQELLDALRMARDHIACSVCHHDETERRGLIWTECLQCGGMFADDEGGVPKPKEPPVLAVIRKALGEQQ